MLRASQSIRRTRKIRNRSVSLLTRVILTRGADRFFGMHADQVRVCRPHVRRREWRMRRIRYFIEFSLSRALRLNHEERWSTSALYSVAKQYN